MGKSLYAHHHYYHHVGFPDHLTPLLSSVSLAAYVLDRCVYLSMCIYAFIIGRMRVIYSYSHVSVYRTAVF